MQNGDGQITLLKSKFHCQSLPLPSKVDYLVPPPCHWWIQEVVYRGQALSTLEWEQIIRNTFTQDQKLIPPDKFIAQESFIWTSVFRPWGRSGSLIRTSRITTGLDCFHFVKCNLVELYWRLIQGTTHCLSWTILPQSISILNQDWTFV